MIRITIATSARLMSDLIRVVCEHQPDFQVVGCSGDNSPPVFSRDCCDVIVASHNPDSNEALALVRTVTRSRNAPAVVVMGLPNIEPLVLRYLEAGAAGCIREQDSSAELVRAIRLAAARQVALTADLGPMLLKRVASLATRQRETLPPASHSAVDLTSRERQILRLISEGYANREIAQQLTIELGTAKNHVHNILDKLNVKTRRDAALYYSLSSA